MNAMAPNPTLFSEWTAVRAHLLPAIERTHGTHTEDDIIVGLLCGNPPQFQLWRNDKAAIVTEIITYPRLKVVNFFLIGGELQAALALESQVIDFALEKDIHRLTGGGRTGWGRAWKDAKSAGTYWYKDI